MRRVDPGILVLGFVVLLCIAIAVPVVVEILRSPEVLRVPPGVWIATYAIFLAGYVATTILVEHPRRSAARLLFVVQQACAIAAVGMLDGGVGFVAVVLVFGAALGVYLLPLWAVAIVVAANTAAVVLATAGTPLANQAATGAFYLAIQAVSVLTVWVWRAQERSQRELARAHVELAATNALLDQAARSEERLRISRDLHDVAGHGLTALALELEIAGHRVEGPAAEHVARAREIARGLLGDVRATVSRLREDDASLDDALRALAEGVPQPRVDVAIAPGVSPTPEQTTALVRAAQEALTNTIRHAESASTLTVRVELDGDSLVFLAEDDGWGPRDVTPGNGLRGLRERAEALGGSARFGRASAGGFQVRMEVPR